MQSQLMETFNADRIEENCDPISTEMRELMDVIVEQDAKIVEQDAKIKKLEDEIVHLKDEIVQLKAMLGFGTVQPTALAAPSEQVVDAMDIVDEPQRKKSPHSEHFSGDVVEDDDDIDDDEDRRIGQDK